MLIHGLEIRIKQLNYWRVRMFEYPEIKTLVKQMQNEIIGKTIKSGTVVKKNKNMFMNDENRNRG